MLKNDHNEHTDWGLTPEQMSAKDEYKLIIGILALLALYLIFT